MDMTAASTPSDFVDGATYGRVPAPDVNEPLSALGLGVFATANTSRIFDAQVDHDWRTSVHGITMGVGFIFVLPAGTLLLKILKSVLWHGVAQTVGVILVAVGFVAAVGLSKEFNRVSGLSSLSSTFSSSLSSSSSSPPPSRPPPPSSPSPSAFFSVCGGLGVLQSKGQSGLCAWSWSVVRFVVVIEAGPASLS